MKSNAMLMPAVWGGLVFGVPSSLPFVQFCCCLWVVLGGMMAAYVLQANSSEPILVGDGALVGFLAGLVGAVVAVILSQVLSPWVEPIQRAFTRQMLQRAIDMSPNVPPGVREAMDNIDQPTTFSIVRTLFNLVLLLVIGAIFGTLGGLLGAVMFKKKSVAQAT
jgi:hypothetical protein